MAHYELDEEQRIRTRHALLKDEGDLKRTKKGNLEEGLDVSDIERKLHLLRGSDAGTPGLIQIFSSQTELFDESKAKRKVDDPAQMSIEDAMREPGDGIRWADDVPHIRPKAGQEVLGLDDEKYTITDAVGFARQPDEPNDLGVFVVRVIPAHRAGGYTVDDKREMFIVAEDAPEGDAEPWRQQLVANAGELRAAVEQGTASDADDTVGSVDDFGGHGTQEEGDKAREIENAPRRARGRPRKAAGAGNLAGAVSKTVARATGDKKIPVGSQRGGRKKKD